MQLVFCRNPPRRRLPDEVVVSFIYGSGACSDAGRQLVAPLYDPLCLIVGVGDPLRTRPEPPHLSSSSFSRRRQAPPSSTQEGRHSRSPTLGHCSSIGSAAFSSAQRSFIKRKGSHISASCLQDDTVGRSRKKVFSCASQEQEPVI